MPWFASLPGFRHTVAPIFRSPPDSWMCPWIDRSGWRSSISRRTAVEDRVDGEVVVVSRDQVERNVRVGEALRREPHPRFDAFVHQPVQQHIALGGIAGEPLCFLAGRNERVVADIGDIALEPSELLVTARGPLDSE